MNEDSNIVTLSFRQVCHKRNGWVPRGNAFLEIDVIGDCHTLTTVARKLFDWYLGEMRGEGLYDHLWRFEIPPYDGDTLALDVKIPILSQQMMAREPYPFGFASPRRYPLRVGSEMMFHYDEGDTTRIAVTVERIENMKPMDSPELFPRRKGAQAEAFVAALSSERDRAEGDGHSLTVDQAFPFLKDVILSKRYTSYFGRCGKDLCGAVEGGITDNGDQLYCPLQFECLEDYLIAANRAWPKIAEILAEGKIREGWISLMLFPPDRQEEEEEERFVKYKDHLETHKDDFWMMCGPLQVLCRATVEEVAADRAALRDKGFDLAKLYPTLHMCTLKKNCVGKRKNIWFKTFCSGRVEISEGAMKHTTQMREAKTVVQEASQPHLSVGDLFQAVEDTLKNYVTPAIKKRRFT